MLTGGQEFLEVQENVKIAGSKIRTVGWMIKQLPVKFRQNSCCAPSRMWTSIVMEEHNTCTLKKSFEQMYVPQERQPFIYTSLELDPRNVHPAKHEVHFLHEDSVIDKVRSAVESKLLGCNAARKFYAQMLLMTDTY
ncbi:DNA mismatch repair protein Mlh1-like isoform X2 [Periplaneta americana]|uniref:DNA mismatch repair protein Mlh1-like isoform X2 n=1 Tax=Periplaneta americana TaxID=6978 RepID=UPI0037E8FDF2